MEDRRDVCNTCHRRKWTKGAKEGIVVAGGNTTKQLSFPRGLSVDQFGDIYVVDHGNDRVTRWCEGEKKGTVVFGGNGKGSRANQLNYLIGLAMDREGNVYVADMWNHRIQTFPKYQRARGMAV